MTSRAEIPNRDFDVVAAPDNALPQLSLPRLRRRCGQWVRGSGQAGSLIASLRDYDTLSTQRPKMQEPAFYRGADIRRIIHQVWDWIDHEHYAVHLLPHAADKRGIESASLPVGMPMPPAR